MRVSRTQIARTANLDESSPTFILISRILIGMMALLLVIIPWSERYSTLDSFPRGGDTELGLLTIFAVFGLILLFLRAAKKQIRNLLRARYFLFSVLPLVLSLLADCHHRLGLADRHRTPLPGSSLDAYNLPLQI